MRYKLKANRGQSLFEISSSNNEKLTQKYFNGIITEYIEQIDKRKLRILSKKRHNITAAASVGNEVFFRGEEHSKLCHELFINILFIIC